MNTKRDSLLLKVADHYQYLWAMICEHRSQQGLGAIVFTDENAEVTAGRVECEYWPMGRLRDCLRQLDEYDESVYRWLRQAEACDGLPVVVFSPGSKAGTLDLTFHTMTQAHKN